MKYFDHDVDAGHDEGIVALRLECGGAAVDAYWTVLEHMYREEDDFAYAPDSPATRSTAHMLCTDVQTLGDWLEAMERCGLLESDGAGRYGSERVRANVAAYRQRVETARENGRRGGRKPRNNRAGTDSVSSGNRAAPDNQAKEKEKEKEKIGKEEKVEKKKGETRRRYGEYGNVLLTDSDLDKLKAEFPGDWAERIERLSGYIASTGKSYKNHLATIRNWARKDAKAPPGAVAASGAVDPFWGDA